MNLFFVYVLIILVNCCYNFYILSSGYNIILFLEYGFVGGLFLCSYLGIDVIFVW